MGGVRVGRGVRADRCRQAVRHVLVPPEGRPGKKTDRGPRSLKGDEQSGERREATTPEEGSRPGVGSASDTTSVLSPPNKVVPYNFLMKFFLFCFKFENVKTKSFIGQSDKTVQRSQ